MIYDKFTAPAGNGILFQPKKSLLHVSLGKLKYCEEGSFVQPKLYRASICPGFDNEFRHIIVKVVFVSTRLSPRGSSATLTMF